MVQNSSLERATSIARQVPGLFRRDMPARVVIRDKASPPRDYKSPENISSCMNFRSAIPAPSESRIKNEPQVLQTMTDTLADGTHPPDPTTQGCLMSKPRLQNATPATPAPAITQIANFSNTSGSALLCSAPGPANDAGYNAPAELKQTFFNRVTDLWYWYRGNMITIKADFYSLS